MRGSENGSERKLVDMDVTELDLGTALTEGIDLTSDEAWVPTFSPYHGRLVPMWKITQMARIRMQIGEPE